MRFRREDRAYLDLLHHGLVLLRGSARATGLRVPLSGQGNQTRRGTLAPGSQLANRLATAEQRYGPAGTVSGLHTTGVNAQVPIDRRQEVADADLSINRVLPATVGGPDNLT